jgi:hypothetical protein
LLIFSELFYKEYSLQKMRILIATHAHLSPEFGAGQVAIHLAEEFRKQGHDVTLWSPHPMPHLPRWWQQVQNVQLMRAKLNEFLDSQEAFDVIDCMGSLITKKVSRSASVIVSRSVQPDILYIISGFLNPKDKGLKKIGLFIFNALFGLFCIFLSLQGWSRATYILCLGSLELEWMKKWFPWWKNKLFFYLNTISEDLEISVASVKRATKELSDENIIMKVDVKYNNKIQKDLKGKLEKAKSENEVNNIVSKYLQLLDQLPHSIFL